MPLIYQNYSSFLSFCVPSSSSSTVPISPLCKQSTHVAPMSSLLSSPHQCHFLFPITSSERKIDQIFVRLNTFSVHLPILFQ